MPFNNVDYFVLFLSLFSIYSSVKKGLMEDMVSSISIMLSLGVTYVFGLMLEKIVYSLFHVRLLSLVVSYAVVFVALLSLFFYVMNLIVPNELRKTPMDKMLGGVYGFFKFFFIFIIVIYILHILFVGKWHDILENSYLIYLADQIVQSDGFKYVCNLLFP
ncbi:MAG: CvpA family protein [Alphaproteobacteria bacterium]|jgi:uncharacterized membrane protein required for colicin V production|nr:CvpA family protein [Alphaproteobacteria bacterium]